jgi:hypothetical protein
MSVIKTWKPHRYLPVIILFMSQSNHSFGQKSDIGNWFIYFGNQKINTKWNWHNELQYRSYNFIDDTNQLLFRTGIGYNLSENNDNILVGYGFIQSHTYTNTEDKNVRNEHRVYQQFLTKQNIHNFYIQHRYRIEERFFSDDCTVRFRYFLSINKPLNKKTLEKNALYLSAYNEIFLNAEKPVFDRNRLYGGIGYCINKHLRVETGYMAQMLENKTQSQFQIIVFNNIPFHNN